MILEKFRLDGKVSVVSGASRGIGKAIARGLVEAGSDVVIVGRSKEVLEVVAGELQREGRKVIPLELNVCNIGQIDEAIGRMVDIFGHVDILFNVAGTTVRKPVIEVDEEDYDLVMNTNLKGAYFMAKAVGSRMVKQGYGKVINIASLTSIVGLADTISLYAASKGAVAQMTKVMAIEWAPFNIQVNAIAPGFIVTDFNRKFWKDESRKNWVLSRTPSGRLGQVEDLVGTAVFLASPASDFITGQVIVVDGGFLAGSRW